MTSVMTFQRPRPHQRQHQYQQADTQLVDLDFLTDVERQIIMSVLDRDATLRQKEQTRIKLVFFLPTVCSPPIDVQSQQDTTAAAHFISNRATGATLFRNSVTFTFDLLTSFSQYSQRRPWTTYVPTLMLLVHAVFILERRHSQPTSQPDRHTHTQSHRHN